MNVELNTITPVSVVNFSGTALVGIFNANCERAGMKPVKKFADLATAQKRVLALVDALAQPEPSAIEAHPSLTAEQARNLRAEAKAIKAEAQAEAKAAREAARAEKSRIKAAAKAARKAAREARAAAKAAQPKVTRTETWLNPEIKAARSERHGCVVTGPNGAHMGVFGSVRSAFKALGLPDAKHIPFRMAMKAAGYGEFDGFKFVAVDLKAQQAATKAQAKAERAAAKAERAAAKAEKAATGAQVATEATDKPYWPFDKA